MIRFLKNMKILKNIKIFEEFLKIFRFFWSKINEYQPLDPESSGHYLEYENHQEPTGHTIRGNP
jgi:hypothetical protein